MTNSELPYRIVAFAESKLIYNRLTYFTALKECFLLLKDINNFSLLADRDLDHTILKLNLGDTSSLNKLMITHALCAEGLISAEVLAGLSEIAASKSKCDKSRKALSDYQKLLPTVSDDDVRNRTKLYKKLEYLRVLGALTYPGVCSIDFITRESARMLHTSVRVLPDDPIRTDDFSYEETVIFWCKVGLWCCDNDLLDISKQVLFESMITKVIGNVSISSMIQVEARARALISAYARLKDDEDTFSNFCKENIQMREDIVAERKTIPKSDSPPF